MNDRAEQAFRDAFAEHAAEDLGSPRQPQRRRFDVRWAVAAAVALVVLAIPVGMALMNRGGTSPNQPVVASPQPTNAETPLGGLPEPKPGWKWVSRGDIAVQVPAAWEYSNYSWMPWCLDTANSPAPQTPTKPEGPYVDSPAGVVPAIACPEVGPEFVQMHLGFGDAPLSDTTVKTPADGRKVFVVMAKDPKPADEALAGEILATARTFERDAAGCTPIGPITGFEDRPAAWDIANATGITAVGICRYSDNAHEPTQPNLVGSRLILDEATITDLVDGIAGAPGLRRRRLVLHRRLRAARRRRAPPHLQERHPRGVRPGGWLPQPRL